MSLTPSGNDLSCSAATIISRTLPPPPPRSVEHSKQSRTYTHTDHEAHSKDEEEGAAFTGMAVSDH